MHLGQDFLKGNLKQTVQSARVNPLSKRMEDHKFDEFADKVRAPRHPSVRER